jgi:hypothetical protein
VANHTQQKETKLVWPMACCLIARNVIMIDDLRWIEPLARLAPVLMINDQSASAVWPS